MAAPAWFATLLASDYPVHRQAIGDLHLSLIPDPSRAQLDAWDKVIAKKAGENPLFKKVLDSQKEFAGRAGQWQNDYMVDFKMAYNRYFSKGKKA
mgnify:CR=1 FL=1